MLALFSSLHFDFIDDIESATIVALKIRSTQLPYRAVLLDWSKETLSDVADKILFLDLTEVVLYLLLKGHAMLVKPELLLNLSQVIFLAIILVLLENLHTSPAVARSDMLDEHGTITDKLSFKCVNEWAVSAIETVRAADLMDGKYDKN